MIDIAISYKSVLHKKPIKKYCSGIWQLVFCDLEYRELIARRVSVDNLPSVKVDANKVRYTLYIVKMKYLIPI